MSIFVLLSAWSFRQSNGRLLYELYSQVSQPFAAPEDRANVLIAAHTRELAASLAEQKQEYAILQETINQVSPELSEPLFAPIVGRSADHWWQNIIIGRGAADGISIDDVVVAPGGLVGRVVSVASNTSRVLLISDASSRVGITVTRTRASGIMRGIGSTTAIVEFFDKLPEVEVGDAITTSHFSRRFPAGIPIGEVTAVDLSASPAPQVEVELLSPIANLEWVSVHLYSEQSLEPEEELNSDFEVLLDDEEY